MDTVDLTQAAKYSVPLCILLIRHQILSIINSHCTSNPDILSLYEKKFYLNCYSNSWIFHLFLSCFLVLFFVINAIVLSPL